ncbi:MAG: hypothetical protein NC394_07115 [Bacteroides sp.]|nr:hypothetical protein [Bacteroides sp.]
MRKKIFVLMLSAALLLSTAACGKSSENVGDKGTDNTPAATAEESAYSGSGTDGETEKNTASSDEEDGGVIGSDYEILIEGTTVLSEASKGGYTARLELEDIAKLPDEELNAYQALTRAEVTLSDENGNFGICLPSIAELYNMSVAGVWADCADDAVEIYEIEWNGEKRYVLRCYLSYGTENGAYPKDDPELYHARLFSCDLEAAFGDGLEMPYLKPYDIGGIASGDVYISDSLVYKEGNVPRDEKRHRDISFDPDACTAVWTEYEE